MPDDPRRQWRIIGDDGLARPGWTVSDPMMQAYYDTEWGLPVRDEAGMFERISLEAFQSGLSWATILRKRPAFREAFARLRPGTRRGLHDDSDVDRLMADAGIVRNLRKVHATITNARATVALREDGRAGGPGVVVPSRRRRRPRRRTPTPSRRSRRSRWPCRRRWLSRRGFVFVGPTTMYALMEAVGVVDTHLVDSHRRGSSGVWPALRLATMVCNDAGDGYWRLGASPRQGPRKEGIALVTAC